MRSYDWKMRKRIGDAVTWILVLSGFILTWTGLTGPELLDEIAKFQLLEFVGSDVFRTILVITGVGFVGWSGSRWHKTNEPRRVSIGQSLSARGKSTVESASPSPRKGDAQTEDESSRTSSGNDSHAMLQEELRKAVMMKQRGTTIDSWATGMKPVDLCEVVEWERRVLELLEGWPLHVAMFTADPPERWGTLGMSAHWDPVGERLAHRMHALEAILRSS